MTNKTTATQPTIPEIEPIKVEISADGHEIIMCFKEAVEDLVTVYSALEAQVIIDNLQTMLTAANEVNSSRVSKELMRIAFRRALPDLKFTTPPTAS